MESRRFDVETGEGVRPVRVWVDWEGLAERYGPTAWFNRSGKCREARGLVVVEKIPEPQVADRS